MVFNKSITNNTTKRDTRLLIKAISICNTARDHIDTLPFCKHLIYECHTICRAIAMVIPELRVVDGNYLGFTRTKTDKGYDLDLCTADHSWLTTPDDAIIDPYPVGFLAVNPVLVVTKGHYAPFGGQLYIPDNKITAKISTRSLWRKSHVLYRFIQVAERISGK